MGTDIIAAVPTLRCLPDLYLPAVPQLGTTPPSDTIMGTYFLAAVPTLRCLPDNYLPAVPELGTTPPSDTVIPQLQLRKFIDNYLLKNS